MAVPLVALRLQQAAWVHTPDVMAEVWWQDVAHRHPGEQGRLRIENAASLLQALVRGHQARQHTRYIRTVIGMQARLRGNMDRSFVHFIRAVVLIQARWRGYEVRLYVRELKAAMNAATAIQSAWRGMMAKKRVRRIRAAVVIQAHWQGHAVRLRMGWQT